MSIENIPTNAVAAAAASSPWWLPELHTMSTWAAELAPILGVAWLAMQMVNFIATKVVPRWSRPSR